MAENGDLLPARMLNEFAYCPRLFHLEWVQSQFSDNDDTVEGRFHHRRVDREEGGVPLPEDGEIRRASSVLLSSEKLGVIARVDVIEGDGTLVIPVDTKRGSPPDNEYRSWEPERIQVCLQGLLLREAGYQCEEGVLYYAEARTRVTVSFDVDLVARTLEVVRDAAVVAATDDPPPPLLDSPKCPRCSLVGICLPDEINTLRERQERPRRLMAQVSDARPLYVSEQGAYVGVSKGRVVVRKKGEELASVRAIDVSQVCVQGNVQVTSQAIRSFFANEVPVVWFSYGGWFSGIGHGLPSKNVDLRRRQVALAGQGGLEVARSIVAGKIANARTFLMRNSRSDRDQAAAQLRSMRTQAIEAASVASLLGIEGTAARIYFGQFSTMLRKSLGFDFDGRNRRPPRDPVNALLSYVYGLLVKDLTATAYAVGFDPYLGFYHRPKYGRPALALDLAEEFRALVGDSVVLQVINNGEVKPHNFISRAGGVSLDRDGRRTMIAAYERRLDMKLRHPSFGYLASYRRLYELQTRIMAAYVVGELDEYEPLVTR